VTETQRRTRVLMLLDRLEPHSGGGERFAVGLAAHLPRDRFEVTLCATREVLEPWRGVLDESGVPWFGLGRRATWDILPFRGLVRFLRRRDVDVLHAHMFGSNVWGSVIGRAARVPVVVAHEQTWDYEGKPLRKLLDGRLIGRLAHAFVAVSSADRDRMIALEGVPADKVVVEPNAYVPRTGERSTWDPRAELGVGAETPLIGTACIFRPQKRLDVLLDAFARVRTPDARLVLAGDGPERTRLGAQAERLGVADRVHFMGLRDDVDALLRGVTVAVMSSDFEGTPLFGFECMAAGTPLVATAVGGLPDMVDHGESALLVPRRDPGALAAALDELLADPDRRTALAAAARERLAGFEIGAVATRFAELYDLLLDERGR
jgi:glycosyltransferase involved in cell wall biosynthesis